MFGFGNKKKIQAENEKAADFLNAVAAQDHHTPDLYTLEQRKYNLLFVYDHMMMNRQEVNADDGIKFLGTAFTRGNYTMFKKLLGESTFPLVVERKYSYTSFSPVRGQLFGVRGYKFLDIDQFKSNGLVFQRKRVYVQIPFRSVKWTKEHGTVTTTEKVCECRAWMYIALPSYWDSLIDGGYSYQPCNTYNSKSYHMNNYYYFSRKHELNGIEIKDS